jgi:hypothetical protein
MKYDYELIPIGTPVPVSFTKTKPCTMYVKSANAYLINDDFTRVVLGLYIHSACTFTFGFIVDDL